MGDNMKVYITKNKVTKLKSYPNNNYGIQILNDIRWAEKNDPEFKQAREKILQSNKYKKERTDRSIRRTRKNIQDILNANLDDKSYFVTLTYAENLQDYKKANEIFNNFIRLKNKNIKYLCVKEHQQRGAIHYHMIVFDIEKEKVKQLVDSWKHGKIKHYKKITNFYTYKIANYMTDYFAKEKNQRVKAGYKIFTKSRNLKKPLIISDKVVDKILGKHNYNIDLVNYDWLQHDYIIENKSTHNLAVDIFI